MIIKKTDFGDLPVLKNILEQCINTMQNKGLDFWDEFYPNQQVFENDIRQETLYTLIQDEEIIGCVTINDEMSPEYLDGNWKYSGFKVIHRLMIDPLKQGNGYSKTGMVLIEKILKDMGIKSIRLSVYIKNIRANQLYKNMGFQLRGTTELKKGPCYLYEKKIL